jgi:exodeoxyribonuclease V gamma subunit
MTLLEVSAAQRRFGLDQAGVERLRTWVSESGIRWGLDGDMRRALDLPNEEHNTWRFGLGRLFLGYALPPETTLYQGIAPYPDVEGAEAVGLGTLQELVTRLGTWRERLSKPLAAVEWPGRINDLLRDFFAPDMEEETDLQTLRDAVEELAGQAVDAGMVEPLSTELVAAALDASLTRPGSPSRFLTGAVTFCNMVPMRSIPFRVVCLLGLNDTDFPRRQRPVGFDLMADDHRRGDRARRRDDRYLFLEAVLSARDCLYISWVGRDVRDDSPRVPSVLVSELLDYLGRAFRSDGREPISGRLVVEHPLQPFSPRYFSGNEPRLFSYARDWCAAAARKRGTETPPFADRILPAPEPATTVLELDELIRFFANPAAAFLGQRLGLRLLGDAEMLEDLEIFAPDGLQRYNLRQALLGPAMRGEGIADIRPLLRAQGGLPHGAVGELVLREQIEVADAFAARLRPRLAELDAESHANVEVALSLEGFRLSGWLPRPEGNRAVTYRFGRLRAKDRLGAWIRHLALCLWFRDQPIRSTHVAEDYSMELAPVTDATGPMMNLLEAMREGLTSPLCFFPETSLAWAGEEAPTGNVWTNWSGDRNAYAEARDPWVRIAWRGREPLQLAVFGEVARRIWRPLLEASELITAERDLSEFAPGSDD